jgi:tRNA U34 5-methylaminomethyl-2-thiouridine-forming methyltransferase MnmC
MGLGTGLNAFVTAIEAEERGVKIRYTAVEQFPLSMEEAVELNYAAHLGHTDLFLKIHESEWGKDIAISECFTIRKHKADWIDYLTHDPFHLIYYDAFAPNAQPELWTKDIFKKLFQMLQPHGGLVTYCSKGDVRRAMMAAGFIVKKLPGPPGKREMLRAIRV